MGLFGKKQKKKPSKKYKEGGHIAMSFDDFKKHYQTLSHI